MPINTTCIQDDSDEWSAEHCAVWVEEMAEADGTPRVTMLCHPNHPFVKDIGEPGGAEEMEQALRKVAHAYVDTAKERARIDQAVVDALKPEPGDGAGFGWLSLGWGAHDHLLTSRDPRKSFWVERKQALGSPDRTVVLLAGQRDSEGRSLGAEIGLRVVMHVPSVALNGERLVRVTGMTMSNLPTPEAIERINALAFHDFSIYLGALRSLFSFVKESKPAIHGATFLDGDKASRLRIFGAGSRSNDPDEPRTYAYVSEIDEGEIAGETARMLVLFERVSNAEVFEREPASSGNTAALPKRRPTRPSGFLDTYRQDTDRLPPEEVLNGAPTGWIPLEDNLVPGVRLWHVRQTRIGNDRGDPDKVHKVPVDTVDTLQLRSDDLAAVHAYMRGFDFFERLIKYGIDPEQYFKLAKLPLILRHRAPIRGARDGKTVNAQVRPTAVGLSMSEDWKPGADDERPQLEVRFAAANLAHRRLLPNDVQRLRAQPLGLAADQRWAWHEFGHVLGYASTGATEFRFAHSAGDALAAIVADPDSTLARNEYSREGTFPWVHIVRRHDRDADASWCWCGRRNVARLANADALDDQRLGYFQEQLLSSSLFRFYRCIGGDTFSHHYRRRGASDYAVYLIMQAIALLGPDGVVPARTANRFASALMQADVGTGVWDVNATWPERQPAPRRVLRVGGCVHKVLRWAFEMQGLYATGAPRDVVEGVGKPPPVDVYIADQRGGAAGGYDPVELVWNVAQNQPWHASEDAISVAGGKVTVTVGNRGRIEARNVRVSVRVSPAAGVPVWTSLNPNPWSPPQHVPADDGEATFEFTAPGSLPPAPYLIWARATCQADRVNNPVAGLPADPELFPLVDLIANDNNQGLRLIT